MFVFETAAKATGCQVEVNQPDGCPTHLDIFHNSVLAKSYLENIKALGVSDIMEEHDTLGSTDMGNVSYVVPSIHPMYKIGSGETNHTREFTQVSNTPEAHIETLTAAKAMAHTCIDVLTTDGLLEEIKKCLETKPQVI